MADVWKTDDRLVYEDCLGDRVKVCMAYDKMTAAQIAREHNAHAGLLAACERSLPWIGKMIADGAHKNAVAPNDCIGAMNQLQAAITAAKEG